MTNREENREGQKEEFSAERESLDRVIFQIQTTDEDGLSHLFPLLYAELKSIARAQMARESSSHTLQPTALVNEAFLRMAPQLGMTWKNREHFLAVAGTMMRRILISHARKKKSNKRSGDRVYLTLSELVPEANPLPLADWINLDRLLDQLNQVDTRKAQLVTLRYFGGLGSGELGTLYGLSRTTVKRELQFARAWLLHRLRGESSVNPAK